MWPISAFSAGRGKWEMVLAPARWNPGWCRSSLPGCVVSTIFLESILMYQHCNINVCNACQMQGCEFASQVRAQGAQSRPKSWPWSIQTPKRLSFSMLQLPKNLAVGDGRQPNWYEEIDGAVLWNGLLDGDWLTCTKSDQSNSFCCAMAGDCRDGNAEVLILLASIMWFRHVQERRSWSACLVTTQ